MISNDTQNPGNFGMQFIPQWISDIAINDVRVQIVLPPDVTVADVKTTQNFYNGTSTVNGQLAVYWEKPSHPSQTSSSWSVFLFQPSSCLTIFRVQAGGRIQLGALTALFIGVVGVLFAIVIFALIFRALSKSSYASPKVSMETLRRKTWLNRG